MIKVCGLRDSQNIREIARLGVDWIGMIFWPRSKRYVSAPTMYGVLVYLSMPVSRR